MSQFRSTTITDLLISIVGPVQFFYLLVERLYLKLCIFYGMTVPWQSHYSIGKALPPGQDTSATGVSAPTDFVPLISPIIHNEGVVLSGYWSLKHTLQASNYCKHRKPDGCYFTRNMYFAIILTTI